MAPRGTAFDYPCSVVDVDGVATVVSAPRVSRCANADVAGGRLQGTMGASACDGFISAVASKAGMQITLQEPIRLEPVLWTTSQGAVSRVVVGSGGRTVVGGSFLGVNPSSTQRFAVLSSDGSLVDNCNYTGGVNDVVNSVVALADGTFVLGGAFTSVAGEPAAHLARVDCSGRLTPGFAAQGTFNGDVNRVLLWNDQLYVVGAFSRHGTVNRGRVARLTLQGVLDPGWPQAGTGFNGEVADISVDGLGAYVVGSFTSWNGTATPAASAARITSDGAIDTTFAPTLASGNGSAAAVLIAENGTRVYVATRSKLFKLDATTGAAAPEFTALSCSQFCNSLALDGGAVWVGASSDSVRKVGLTGMVLLTLPVDGTVLGIFGGQVYVSGAFTQYQGSSVDGLVRVSSATGAHDSTFTPPGGIGSETRAMAFLSTGDLLFGGGFTQAGGDKAERLVRFDVNGHANTANPSLDGDVRDLIWDASRDTYYAAGDFTDVDGLPRAGLAAFGSDLDPLTSFVPPPFNSTVLALAVSGSNLLVGGDFNSCGATSTGSLCRLVASTGARDTAFGSANAVTGVVSTIEVRPDGIYAGGDISSVGPTTTGKVVRVSSTGVLDPTFNFLSIGSNRSVSMVRHDGTRLVVATNAGLGYGGTGSFSLFAVDDTGGLQWSSTAYNNAGLPYVLLLGTDVLVANKRYTADGTLVRTFGTSAGIRHAAVDEKIVWLAGNHVRTSLSATLSPTVVAFDAVTGSALLDPLALGPAVADGVIDALDRVSFQAMIVSPYTGHDQEAYARVSSDATVCDGTEAYSAGSPPTTSTFSVFQPGRYRICGRWRFGADTVYRLSNAVLVP